MGINIDKVLEQKKNLESKLARGGGSGARVNFWRPSDGDNTIRILPPWVDEGVFSGQFWREIAQHWGVSPEQKGPVMCPAKTPYMEGACPICELVDELRQDKSNPEAQTMAKDLRAKVAYLLNVVDRNDPEYTAKDVAEHKKSRPDAEVPFTVGQTKIQHYACPSTIFEQILGLISRNKSDITDLSKGRDLTITKHPNKDKKLTRYTVTPGFEVSEVTLRGTELPALDGVGFVMEYDAMTNLLASGPAASIGSTKTFAPNAGYRDPALPTAFEATNSDDDLATAMRKQLNK